LAPSAVLGPVPIDRDGVPGSRALVRFDYAHGAAVTATLRASVVSAAVKARGRRPARGRARVTLAVRLDPPRLEL
ncbi:MAG: primosomal protein N', partial [Microbacterium sp.]